MKRQIRFLVATMLFSLAAAPAKAEDLWGSGVGATGESGQVKPASYGVLARTASRLGGGADCDGCVTNGDAACGTCCATPCCCNPLWKHRSGVFGEVLWLRPGNVDVVYATEQTSFDPTLASPTGPIGRVNVDLGTGFRIGAGWAVSDSSSLVATYSWLSSDTSNVIQATPGNVLNLEVGHPSVVTSGATSLSAAADYDIDFQLVDLDYRSLLWGNCDAAINYTAGIRYAHLSQEFLATQEIFSAAGLTRVASEIDFDGFGIRFGLDGIKRHRDSGVLVYAKGHANFVAGEFKANFWQQNQFGGAAVIRNDFADYRVLSILETELGLGWESGGGRLRVTGGYMVQGWFNALTTGTYIDGVQAGNFTDLAETLAFNGLVGRLELRY
jgi:hypothetical protein